MTRSVPLIVTLLAPFAAGCGETLQKAGGRVLVDGVPVTHGTIQFCPVGKPGRPASGTIGDDGRFTLSFQNPGDGLPPGEYKVVIIADIWKDQPKTKQQSQDEAMLKSRGIVDESIGAAGGYLVHVVPPEYNTPERTPLTQTVEAARGTLDFVFDIPVKKKK